MVGEELVYQVYGEGDFRKAQGASLDASGTWPGNGGAVYSMAVQPGGNILLGTTDFATYGEVELRTGDGDWIATVPTGIAPGVIRVTGMTADVVDVQPTVADEVARYDLLGRPVPSGASGPQVVVMSDGRARLEWRAAD